MFGAAAAAAPTGPQAEAQRLCLELSKRMEEFYPVLKQAAGDRSAAVSGPCAGHASQNGFVAFTYSFSANPQLLAQANSGQFNPAQHVDAGKWMQAVQNNPDPQSCYPEALVGLPALEQRLGQQQKAVEECTRALDELRQGFGNLKDHLQVQSLQRLEECRQRQQRLSRQLLQVVAALERRALEAGAARRDPTEEARLEARLSRLEDATSAPGGSRARLQELWAVLRGLLQQGPLSGGPESLQDADAERVLRLTESQGEMLELLSEEVGRRRRDVAQFENVLQRFAAQQAPLRGI